MRTLIFILITSTVAMSQTLTLIGVVQGQYGPGFDTIKFVDAYGLNIQVCAPQVIVIDSELRNFEAFQGDCNFTCDSTRIPAIATFNDYWISDDEWDEDGIGAIILDSADFYNQEFIDLMRLYGSYVLNEISPGACQVDSFYVTDVNISPSGGIDRPPGGTRTFDIGLAATSAGRTGTARMTLIRTLERYEGEPQLKFLIEEPYDLEFGNLSEQYFQWLPDLSGDTITIESINNK